MSTQDAIQIGPAYLDGEMRFHAGRHFTPEGVAALAGLRIQWNADAADAQAPAALVIPPGGSGTASRPWQVPFAGTRLTLWNPVAAPAGWRAWPNDEAPLWHFAPSGTAMPAWDLAGNLLRLMTLAEETSHPQRDRHGRVTGAMSERDAAGLLEVPAFNEAVGAIVALGRARAAAGPGGRLDDALLGGAGLPVRPGGVVLSHDLDILRGNDPITQAIRVYRWLRPLAAGRPAKPRGARALLTHATAPYRHYRDVVARIVEIERAAEARSTFYFLNGSGGRFGARSGPRDIPATRALIPPGWDVGMHYNYDTLLDGARFRAQRDELQQLLGAPVAAGRAHYLRFDPARSFAFLDAMGIAADETLGWPDRAGFRAGVAGAYHPADPRTGRALQLVEIPLALMDVALERQYPGRVKDEILRLFRHVHAIGGALPMVVHLEAVGRPELDEDTFDYPGILDALRRAGARFMLPSEYR